MIDISLQYVYDWKMTKKFDELYHKEVSISGILDSSLMSEEEIDFYNRYKGDECDEMYTKMKDFEDAENRPKIYLGSSLKLLLQENGYPNYEGPIKVYGVFGIHPTTKTHIAKIWKADILDKNRNVVETIEKQIEEVEKKGLFKKIFNDKK
ncbi:hypothetical protein MK079_05475 [Candidatus Gracilibacteria bacterium]|nr:hypothetical protein [Candidatus Gracilibacteria bacterium]